MDTEVQKTKKKTGRRQTRARLEATHRRIVPHDNEKDGIRGDLDARERWPIVYDPPVQIGEGQWLPAGSGGQMMRVDRKPLARIAGQRGVSVTGARK